VIEVGVGYHHRIQAARVERKRTAVLILFLAASLMHAAFEQHLGAITAFHEVTGAGDLLNRTEKSEQGHGFFLVLMMKRVCRFERERVLMQVSWRFSPNA